MRKTVKFEFGRLFDQCKFGKHMKPKLLVKLSSLASIDVQSLPVEQF